jgi:hypothetical protein
VDNNYEQVESILRKQLDEVIHNTEITQDASDLAVFYIVSYHVRFWEYRPSVIRKATGVFARGNGFIETPEWLKNTDNQCFIKCVYRAINYDKKNRNNNRDVRLEELEVFRKQFNCKAIGDDYVDVGLFEEDNPSFSIDIYHIPFRKKGVSIIYRSNNTNPKYRVNLVYLEDDESGTHYVIITKLHLLFKEKYEVKHGEMLCYWCKAVFRNDKSDAFQKHLIECQQRINYVNTDF